MDKKNLTKSKYLYKTGNKPKISGARFMAETLKGYGETHVFFVEAILRGALVEMETLGINRILTHVEFFYV